MDEELKQKLQKLDIPPPSAEARESAIFLAKQSFAEEQKKTAKSRQGSGAPGRLIHATQVALETMIGRFTMKKVYVFAGSMAALATVLLVTTTHYSTIMQQVAPQPEVEGAVAIQPSKDKEEAKIAASTQPQPVQMPSADAVVASESVTSDTLAAAPPPPPSAPVAMMQKPGNVVMGGMAASPVAPGITYEADRRLSAPSLQTTPPMRRGTLIVDPSYPYPQPPVSGDKFDAYSWQKSAYVSVANAPVSTFSIDVDTASYSYVRRIINQGNTNIHAIPKGAVRIEEMINYFPYNYPVPQNKSEPFKPTVTVYPSPWIEGRKLMHIGIKGYDIATSEKPRANVVFLIDVSGSMNAPDKLPLVKQSLHMLVNQMSENDTIGIVTYAGYAGTALEPTSGSDKKRIHSVIDMLGTGGGTAGAAGIEQAYKLAQAHYNKNGVNRVILATDGDFNVGISDQAQLQKFIEEKRESGVFLSILGFGQGNYNDALMQTLAQNGNGTAAYIDTVNEAKKVLVDETSSTLFPIAKDVKIQVEFNPAMVAGYRLIGYESRLLKREDFNNDKIDAGEIGAGHAVTAIYEIQPVTTNPPVDDLRYGTKPPEEKKPAASGTFNGEYAFLKIRYKLPDENESKLLATPITTAQEKENIKDTSDDVRFATAVAGFGQLLRGDIYPPLYTFEKVMELAESARGEDPYGYRREFEGLVMGLTFDKEMRGVDSQAPGMPGQRLMPAPGVPQPLVPPPYPQPPIVYPERPVNPPHMWPPCAPGQPC